MGAKDAVKRDRNGASLMESHSMANFQFNFFLPRCRPPPSPLSCLPAWLGNWISVVSQGSALLELSGRSEVAGQHCVTANLSLDSSGEVGRNSVCAYACDRVSTDKILCVRVWQVRVILFVQSRYWWMAKREEAREQRQKQIFRLSHLLGGDPEEASLHRLQEAPKRRRTYEHYRHLAKIFSDNTQCSRSLRSPVSPHMRSCAL